RRRTLLSDRAEENAPPEGSPCSQAKSLPPLRFVTHHGAPDAAQLPARAGQDKATRRVPAQPHLPSHPSLNLAGTLPRAEQPGHAAERTPSRISQGFRPGNRDATALTPDVGLKAQERLEEPPASRFVTLEAEVLSAFARNDSKDACGPSPGARKTTATKGCRQTPPTKKTSHD